MTDPLLLVLVLVASVVVHENAHGWTALGLGDPTAKLAGRLTLNPLKHLDPVGSLIMPAVFAFAGAPVLGYARPVPVSPHRLRNQDRGYALVALAGPVSNFLLTAAALVALRALVPGFQGISTDCRTLDLGPRALCYGAQVNLVLAAFNLVPIPPLDGSRILRLVLKPPALQALDRIEPYGFLILFLVIFLLPGPLFRLVGLIEALLVRLLPG